MSKMKHLINYLLASNCPEVVPMVSMFISLIVFVLLVGLVFFIARKLGAPDLWLQIGAAIIGVFGLIWLLMHIGPMLGSMK